MMWMMLLTMGCSTSIEGDAGFPVRQAWAWRSAHGVGVFLSDSRSACDERPVESCDDVYERLRDANFPYYGERPAMGGSRSLHGGLAWLDPESAASETEWTLLSAIYSCEPGRVDEHPIDEILDVSLMLDDQVASVSIADAGLEWSGEATFCGDYEEPDGEWPTLGESP